MLSSALTRVAVLLAVLNSGGLLGHSERFPKGICDPSAQIGYAGQEDASVVAIDLRTGNTVWNSPDASVPLALSEALLAAGDYTLWKSGQFTIAILDPKTGKLRIRSKPIVLGQPPITPADPPPLLDADFEKDGLFVRWETSSRYRGGAPPPIQRANSVPTKMTHIAIVDPLTGGVTEKTPEPTQVASQVDAPNSVSYRRGGEWHKGPWFSGGSTANIESTAEGKDTKIQLRVWDRPSHTLKATIDLATTESEAVPYVTADGKYVLLPSSPGVGPAWRVFSVTNPREIGRVVLGSDPQDICIVGSQLFYLSSISSTAKTATIVLRSVDLDSGRQKWEHPLGQRKIGNMPRLPQ